MQFYLPSEAAQLECGRALAQRLRGRRGVVFLHGDLGAGKTTLVRGLLRELGHEGPVRSPTYTLIEPYETAGQLIYHLDLYRLGDPEEVEFLGLRDLLDGEGLLLVEWPERGAGVLPEADLIIQIDHAPPGRRLRLLPAPDWAPLFEESLV
ncbi:MAG: tRNA (adenosine(37)-N6)-threonylcarbamoyltransferase complex ATPase subunit type 1 TsaE [Thiohalocapsa sp.]